MTTATSKKEVTVDSSRGKLGWILPVCLALAALLFVTGASSYTSQTNFCRSCHEMEGVYNTWQSSAHGKNELGIVAECQDCHLPGGYVRMLAAKVGKLKEPYVHYIVRPSTFEFKQSTPALKVRARKAITDDNCLACHDIKQQLPINQVQQLAHSTAVGTASCVSCHKRAGHRPQTRIEEGDNR